MTEVKAAIHQLVDELSDDDADLALVYLRSVTSIVTSVEQREQPLRVSESDRVRLERAEPVSEDDPLWSLIGTIKDGPDDASTNHDIYLAERYGNLRSDE